MILICVGALSFELLKKPNCNSFEKKNTIIKTYKVKITRSPINFIEQNEIQELKSVIRYIQISIMIYRYTKIYSNLYDKWFNVYFLFSIVLKTKAI